MTREQLSDIVANLASGNWYATELLKGVPVRVDVLDRRPSAISWMPTDVSRSGFCIMVGMRTEHAEEVSGKFMVGRAKRALKETLWGDWPDGTHDAVMVGEECDGNPLGFDGIMCVRLFPDALPGFNVCPFMATPEGVCEWVRDLYSVIAPGRRAAGVVWWSEVEERDSESGKRRTTWKKVSLSREEAETYLADRKKAEGRE